MGALHSALRTPNLISVFSMVLMYLVYLRTPQCREQYYLVRNISPCFFGVRGTVPLEVFFKQLLLNLFDLLHSSFPIPLALFRCLLRIMQYKPGFWCVESHSFIWSAASKILLLSFLFSHFKIYFYIPSLTISGVLKGNEISRVHLIYFLLI